MAGLFEYARVGALVVGGVLLALSPPLPAAGPGKYSLFVAVQPPYQSNRATLQKMLKREGYEASVEGDEELVMVLTADQLKKLFQARVRMQTVAASASDRVITQPALESVTIPKRFEKLIRRVYFDPQRG